MAGISASIQLNDRMTPVLNSITSAMNLMVNSFSAAQTASATAINTAQWTAAVDAVHSASAAVVEYQQELERTQHKPVAVPEPTWAAVSTPQVFMDTGADRFQQEIQSANQMALQLHRTQTMITSQARNMQVVPNGMLSDITGLDSRIQALADRIQNLSNIPVNMRTDQVNNQIESLRGKLNDSVQIQEELNSAMSRMDIKAANTAYQRLNQTIDSAERNIRDNISVQEEFNSRVAAGGASYDGLASKIGGIAAALGIGLMVKNAAQLTYESAAQLEATEAKYHTVFAGMTQASDEFLQKFQTLTPATTAEVRSMASGIQDLLIPMGMQRSAATEMTGEYMHIIGALTNFNSATRTAEDVSGAFQSALSGEYDSLKSLGIQVNETIVKQQAVAMGLASNTNAVSNAAKAQVVLELAYQQSGDALAAYNEESLDTTTRMQLLQKGFQDTFALAGQSLLPRINDMLARVQARMPEINAAIHTFAGVFGGFVEGATIAFDVMMNVGSAVADNWSWLAPIIGGVTAALILYSGAIVAHNIVQGISNGLKAAAAFREGVHAAALAMSTGNTFMATAAQYGLNAALLACPLTWIILIIIGAIAAIYAIVGAINKWKGTTISATGIIASAFAVLGAFIANQFVIPVWNIIAEFINFFYNVWNDPIAAVKMLFFNLASDVVAQVANMARAIESVINNIPNVHVDITSGLDSFQSKIESAAAKVKSESEWKEIVSRREFIDFGTAARSAYEWGAEKEAGVKDMFSNIFSPKEYAREQAAAQENLQNIAGNTGGTAANTAAMADAMDMMDEELKYMRDIAEQEIINRFTLAELKVDVNNNNTLTKKTDFDDMGSFLATFTGEFLAAAAEGGHL